MNKINFRGSFFFVYISLFQNHLGAYCHLLYRDLEKSNRTRTRCNIANVKADQRGRGQGGQSYIDTASVKAPFMSSVHKHLLAALKRNGNISK
ncbi:hypothetical protein GJAV_G00164700 [Gymnothorax javanicus]|nr:hypothetical protein GJAV_G00164700 [Gymnothorax javanicus]